MSRRQHFLNDESYTDWLKTLGCVLYLPLGASGDLQDRISGLSIQLSGNGSMVWDSSEQMYKVTHPSSGVYSYVGILGNGMSSSLFQDNIFTTIHTVKVVTNSANRYFNTIDPNGNTNDTVGALSASYNSTGRTNAWPRTVTNVAYVCDHSNSVRHFYQDGGLFGTFSEYSGQLPSNWSSSGTGITIGKNRTQYFYSSEYYMKEVYLFNTALPLSTIRKIQGYE